ncbi:unnamed protein product [Sphagnum troendelagicum]
MAHQVLLMQMMSMFGCAYCSSDDGNSNIIATLPNCSYPSVYAFGDSMTDTGNGIAGFPDEFISSESDPNGILFPQHAADRYCDGRLLIDFLAFGVRRRPIYAYLRAFAGDFTYGVNFATSGSTARNVSTWDATAKFSTPFSLNFQIQWLRRYKVRLQFYYTQTRVNQSLPSLDALNSSLYVVYSGFQDYMSGFYDDSLTSQQASANVPSVVQAIVAAVQRIYDFGGRDILVVNLPPLGCLPALLTLHPGKSSLEYDEYGCLKKYNQPIEWHNSFLRSSIAALRTTYPDANLYYGNLNAAFYDILKNSTHYGILHPLSACCGHGGVYNYNKVVTCGHMGTVEGMVVAANSSCTNPTAYGSWDGIHPSQAVNRVVATAFLNGRHIEPDGGLNCSPDYSNWYTPN